ncbi:alcohol dehydrogenase catalytic domain-containing protein [Pseudonocardia kunmingensis]|uniref:D-arabinose 1-dehydrogenase-like Zn-dependent alcohol dehydrogenase n=1 Tax=Pseudonocardia kunmingensis TaxID=630975 RepID=A0A543DQJ5_9PSEU|nr:alcohol dehydrogenase catalytic domain-containing protein [Pseudonocardia kunmingensis]TQM11597.1 D-arabinose 1-dehydrogenase-like Zn-dependent alcohol dehydrogenase [Pseudonocardia kunmingensis]
MTGAAPTGRLMRAACLTSFAGPDGVRVCEVAAPSPGPDEVLVAVSTVGANQLDLNTMRGLGPGAQTPLPLVLGIDPAGTVVAQGAGVDGDRRGERVVVKPNISCGQCAYCRREQEADCPSQTVVGVHRAGGAAEYAAVPARNAFDIGQLDFEVATAAVHSVPIALHALRAGGRLDPGAAFLVTGATGAVGSAAVQLGRHVGARVVAASTSRAVAGSGVRAVHYDGPASLVEQVRRLEPAGVDLALDTSGHGDVIGAALQCLGWKGRLVVCSASLAKDVCVDARALYLNRQSVIGAASADYHEVSEALRLVTTGAVRPAVGRRFGLAEMGEAYAAIGDRAREGKVVVHVA